MKKIWILFILAASVLYLPSCKSKVKDADLETSVEATINSNPDYRNVNVNVKDGIATLTGEVINAAGRASLNSIVSGVKGIREVRDNTTLAAVTTDTPVITPDDPLKKSIQDALKDHPGVTADVNDGVVTLTGSISQANLATLMQKISAARPKKIENKLTIK